VEGGWVREWVREREHKVADREKAVWLGRDFRLPQVRVEKNSALAMRLLGPPIWETVWTSCTQVRLSQVANWIILHGHHNEPQV
jgi:hypothetical protein